MVTLFGDGPLVSARVPRGSSDVDPCRRAGSSRRAAGCGCLQGQGGGDHATRRRRRPQGQNAASTTVTESEVNGYLTLEVADDLPSGVVSPAVVMLGQGRASGQAVVDLDRVRQGIGASSVLNPLSYLRGRLPVVATGTLAEPGRHRAAAVRVGDGFRRARPEVRAPADRQLLLAVRDVSLRHQPGRSVHGCPHGSARSRSSAGGRSSSSRALRFQISDFRFKIGGSRLAANVGERQS